MTNDETQNQIYPLGLKPLAGTVTTETWNKTWLRIILFSVTGFLAGGMVGGIMMYMVVRIDPAYLNELTTMNCTGDESAPTLWGFSVFGIFVGSIVGSASGWLAACFLAPRERLTLLTITGIMALPLLIRLLFLVMQ